jgi:hypothetical protein
VRGLHSDQNSKAEDAIDEVNLDEIPLIAQIIEEPPIKQ